MIKHAWKLLSKVKIRELKNKGELVNRLAIAETNHFISVFCSPDLPACLLVLAAALRLWILPLVPGMFDAVEDGALGCCYPGYSTDSSC